MTTPRDPDGSTRIGQDAARTGTHTGADVTGRMAGTDRDLPRDSAQRVSHTETVGPRETEQGLARHKTSAAAVFALVFGLAALFCALTAILAPAAVVFALIGIVLGVVGLKMSKKPHVTGHGVAIGGLVTAVLGLLLGGAVIAGAAVLVNDEGALDRISEQIDDLRDDVPTGDEVQDAVTPG